MQYPDERGLFSVDKRQRLHFGQFFVAFPSEDKRCFLLDCIQVEPSASLGIRTQWQRQLKCSYCQWEIVTVINAFSAVCHCP